MFNPQPKPEKQEKKKKSYTYVRNKTESMPELLKQATIVFNAWVRKRDNGKPCISCRKYLPLQAGHYFNAKNYPEVRFHTLNVNGQCEECNCFKGGNFEKYKEGLIERFGVDSVNILINIIDENRCSFKWDREYLKEIIKKYK